VFELFLSIRISSSFSLDLSFRLFIESNTIKVNKTMWILLLGLLLITVRLKLFLLLDLLSGWFACLLSRLLRLRFFYLFSF